MFCCFFSQKSLNNALNDELNIEQINVLISIDRESEQTRSSSVYYTSSVYFKDTSLYKHFADSDEFTIYEVLHTIIDSIVYKSRKAELI